jgi:hypothetical protein
VSYEDWIYDWAGRACYLMSDPTEPLHQEQMLKLAREWDHKHTDEITTMGEAWAKGE